MNLNFGAEVEIVGHVILSLAVIEPFLYNHPMSDKLPNPHDLFFKGAFTRIEIVTGFIEHYLPKEITAYIDLSTVAVDLESYVSREFKEYFSDVVAQMQFVDGTLGEVYFLFEHKKGPEKLARLQILNYMVQKWFKLIREDKYEGYLPIIIPIIVHHGRRKWRHSLKFTDLFDLPSEDFRQYVPQFEHLLHDISHIDEERFKTTTFLRIVQLIMKYIDNPGQTYKLPEIVGLLQQLQDKDKITEYLALILQYVLRTGAVTIQQAKDIVRDLPHGEETVETTADILRKEGEQIGISLGELNKSKDLLLRNINARFGTINRDIIERIKSIQSVEILDGLFDLSLRVSSFDKLKEQVHRVTDN